MVLTAQELIDSEDTTTNTQNYSSILDKRSIKKMGPPYGIMILDNRQGEESFSLDKYSIPAGSYVFITSFQNTLELTRGENLRRFTFNLDETSNIDEFGSQEALDNMDINSSSIEGLRSDIVSIGKDIEYIKEDIKEVKSDVKGISTKGIPEINTSIAVIGAHFTHVKLLLGAIFISLLGAITARLLGLL